MIENRLKFICETNKRKRGHKVGLYKCSCGKEKEIIISYVKNGNTKSCGCLAKELSAKREFKHGMSRTPEYRSWECIKSRCYRKKDKCYNDYGGRGIIVCEHWRNSFSNFLKDMGLKPNPKLTINRKDNNGNYEPNNCEWETLEEQANNKRNNIILTYNEQSMTISQWSYYLNKPKYLIYNRYRAGWNMERIINE